MTAKTIGQSTLSFHRPTLFAVRQLVCEAVSALANSRFASAAARLASSARAFACATSLSRRALSLAWSLWSFQLFHSNRIPKKDSPATPTTTITPKIAAQISSDLINVSSEDLSICATATLYECVALVVRRDWVGKSGHTALRGREYLARRRAKRSSN